MRFSSLAARLAALLFVASACSELKEAGPGAADGGAGPQDAATADGGPLPTGDGAVRVTVETLVPDRNRPGARSTAGYRPWRSGIAVSGDRVYWVESGTQPGLYSASAIAPCTAGSCVQKLATFARPSAFAATATHVYVADTTVIKRFPYSGTMESVTSSTAEVVNLAADASAVYWTADTDQEMRKTPFGGGPTNSLIRSNGTPVAMAIAGTRLFWTGVDISGMTAAVQSIGTDGSGARELARSANGFHTMRGNGTFLYYAENTPASIHRVTLSSGRNEVVDRDAFGVTDFFVDDTHAYWVEPGDGDFLNGRVRRIAHDAREAETLAVSVVHPVAVAVAGRSVYVASAGTSAASYADGAILRLTLSE